MGNWVVINDGACSSPIFDVRILGAAQSDSEFFLGFVSVISQDGNCDVFVGFSWSEGEGAFGEFVVLVDLGGLVGCGVVDFDCGGCGVV